MLKSLSFLLAVLLITATASAQNHVPNCSFEQYTSCPSNYSQTSNCTGWGPYTIATPDYFNSCATTSSINIPTNFFGYQWPAHGNGYMGLYTYVSNNGWQEYITSAITPLQVGKRYEVSMSVSLPNHAKYATSDLGVYFFDNAPATLGISTAVPSAPQISYATYGPILDTSGWTRLVNYFVADSTYDNIVIGGFTSNTTSTITLANGTSSWAYYYIDSVVIRQKSLIDLNFTDSVFCDGDTIRVPYTLFDTSLFSTTNTLTLQLSNASGSFTSPANIGSATTKTSGTLVGKLPSGTNGNGYRVRIISTLPADTSDKSTKDILIRPLPAPGITSNSPVCENATLTLYGSSNVSGTSYSWTGPGSYTASGQNISRNSMQLGMAGNYILTATANGCVGKDSFTVTVNALPAAPVAGSNSPVCSGSQISLTAASSTGGVSYSWTGPNSFASTTQNPTINNATAAAGGTYSVKASRLGCVSSAGTTTVTITPLPIAQAGAQSPVCVGGTIQLNGNSLANTTYQWTGPLSFTSTTQSPSLPATGTTLSGNYILRVTTNGCVSEPDTVYVTVNLRSRIGGYASPNDTICLGTISTFVAFVQDGGPAPVAQWYRNYLPVGSPNATTFVPSTINTGDIYYCKLTAPDVCATPLVVYTDTIKMVVLPIVTKPEVEITVIPGLNVRRGDMVKFTANVKNGGTTPKYQWYKNGVKLPGAVNASFSDTGFSYMDMVHVSIISEDPCAQDKNAADTVWMQFPTGVKNIDKDVIRLYPNPNNGSFTISGITAKEADVLIIDAIGRTVYHQTAEPVNGKVEIMMSLSTGIYQLKIRDQVLRFSVY